MSAALLCTNCQAAIVADLAGLDAAGRVLCAECYLADPPAADVDGVFAEVAAHMDIAGDITAEPPKKPRKPRAPRKPKAELLTELGQALGCLKQVELSRPRDNSTDSHPAACYYSGPLSELGPAEPRPPIVSLAPLTRMDLEAREIAEQGRADLIRFFQMKAAFKARKAQVPAC